MKLPMRERQDGERDSRKPELQRQGPPKPQQEAQETGPPGSTGGPGDPNFTAPAFETGPTEGVVSSSFLDGSILTSLPSDTGSSPPNAGPTSISTLLNTELAPSASPSGTVSPAAESTLQSSSSPISAVAAPSRLSSGQIAGAVIGPVLLILIVLGVLLVLYKRRQKKNRIAPSTQFIREHQDHVVSDDDEAPPAFESGDYQYQLREKMSPLPTTPLIGPSGERSGRMSTTSFRDRESIHLD